MFSEQKPIETITIIGCGIVGLSTAYQLAKQAKYNGLKIKIRVIEQATEIPNEMGSSFGAARVTRLATAEGRQFIPLAVRSQEIAKELELLTGRKLYIPSGGLIIGPATEVGWPILSANYAKTNNIDCNLKAKEQLAAYESLKVKENEIAYFEPSMGMFVPRQCHLALFDLAVQYGVEFIFEEKYQNFDEKKFGSPMIVHTNKKSYETDKLILAMGPWAQKELSKQLNISDISEQFSVHKCSMYTFKIDEKYLDDYKPNKCPVLIWQTEEKEAFVFFPDVDGSGTVHFALFPITDLYPNTTTPEEIKKLPFLETSENVYKKYIEPHFKGIKSKCEKINNYPFTMNKKENFVLDVFPGNPDVIFADVGSGHGYKHAFAFAEGIAEYLLFYKSKLNIETIFGSFFQQIENLYKQTNQLR